MHIPATQHECRGQMIQNLYLHQQPEPIDPDEETTPVKAPPETPEKPPVLPPEDVPERPAPVPPVRDPGNPDLPGHIISRGGVTLLNRRVISYTF